MHTARSSWRGCSGKDESGGVAWRVAAGSTAEMVDAPELTLTACKLQSMPSCGTTVLVVHKLEEERYSELNIPTCSAAIMYAELHMPEGFSVQLSGLASQHSLLQSLRLQVTADFDYLPGNDPADCAQSNRWLQALAYLQSVCSDPCDSLLGLPMMQEHDSVSPAAALASGLAEWHCCSKEAGIWLVHSSGYCGTLWLRKLKQNRSIKRGGRIRHEVISLLPRIALVVTPSEHDGMRRSPTLALRQHLLRYGLYVIGLPQELRVQSCTARPPQLILHCKVCWYPK